VVDYEFWKRKVLLGLEFGMDEAEDAKFNTRAFHFGFKCSNLEQLF